MARLALTLALAATVAAVFASTANAYWYNTGWVCTNPGQYMPATQYTPVMRCWENYRWYAWG